MTRVIISGSRKYYNNDAFYRAMDYVLNNIDDEFSLISGGARGADTLAEEYAHDKEYSITVFPAKWDLYGKSAGIIRNVEMAKYALEADKAVLVAFPMGDSKGTRNMIAIANKNNIETFIFEV